MKLTIADGLSLPTDAVTQTIGILAKRRAGKSYTARRLVEQLVAAGLQVVIIDPKGDWWGIRAAADGKGAGLPITILGGELVAKLVVEERVSALLDLSLFRKGEVAVFMTGFLEALYRIKAREIYRTPVMLVVDEADAIAPQKPQRGEERMLGAAEDIVRRGGQRGIGCTLITQRSAVLNKNVLTQVQILIALRTIAPQDLKAMDAWIDVHGTEEERRTLMESLPALPVGDAWVWSPGWPTSAGIFERVHVLPIETFDSGATPKPGQKRAEPKTLADVDLEAIRRQMADVVRRAEESDPKALRARVAVLERELTAAKRDKCTSILVPDAAAVEMAKEAARIEARRLHQQQLSKVVASAEAGLGRAARAIDQALEQLKRAADGVREPFKVVTDGVDVGAERLTAVVGKDWQVPQATSAPPAGVGSMPPRRQRILDAIATLNARYEDPPRELVALLAGTGHWVSTFERDLGAMRQSEGLIEYRSPGTMRLTAAAVRLARPRELVEDELHRALLDQVEPRRQRIMVVLLAQRGEEISREDLAEASGTNSNVSTFERDLGWLRSTAGWIDYPSPGRVVALPVLFLAQ